MVEVDFNFLLKATGWDKQEYYIIESNRAYLESRKETILIPEEDYEEAMKVRLENKRKEELLYNTARRNNKGLELEKEGKIDEAIVLYEENIADGYPAYCSYYRLFVLYRRRKDYENEIRVIKRAQEVYGGGFNERLEKAKKLFEKSKKI